MSTWYIDLENGSPTGAATSFATRRSNFNISPSPADEVRVMMSLAPSSIGSCTWTNNSDTLTIPGTASISLSACETNGGGDTGTWSSSGGITSDTSKYRQGSSSIKANITTGAISNMARVDLPSDVVADPNNTFCFWFMYDNLALDTTSITFSFVFDTPIANSTFMTDQILPINVWIPICIDVGSLFGGLGSIRITDVYWYCDTVASTTNVWFDNVFISRGISLNHQISKNTDNETWYSIKSVYNTDLRLDTSGRKLPTALGKYQGATETVTTYVRGTITPTISTNTYQTINYDGADGSPVVVSGGWDTTDMSQQIGDTFIDGRAGLGIGVNALGSYTYYERFYQRRFEEGFQASTDNIGGYFDSGNNYDIGIFLNGDNPVIKDIKGAFGNDYGLFLAGSYSASAQNMYNMDTNGVYGVIFNSTKNTNVGDVYTRGCDTGFNWGAGGGSMNSLYHSRNQAPATFNNTAPVTLNLLSASSNVNYGALLNNNVVKIYNAITSGNSLNKAFHIGDSSKSVTYVIENAAYGESAFVDGIGDYEGIIVRSQKEQRQYNVNKTYSDGYVIESVESGGGLSWKISITGTTRNIIYPAKLLLGPIALNANSEFTFSINGQKSDSTDISARLVIYGGRVPGIPNDVSTEITSTSGATYTLTATPTERCTVEVWCEVWSNTGSTTDYITLDTVDLDQT